MKFNNTISMEYSFRRWFVSLTAMICLALAGFNYAGIDVAYNDIRGNLGATLNQVSRITTVYVLGTFIIVPFSSWLSSQLGRRNYLGWAVICFTVCSFFCGNATNLNLLIVWRFLQGLAAGAMLVSSHTILTESWPIEKRATSQLLVLTGLGLGAALGDPIAGYITDEFSWIFIFFANIPLGIIACLLVFVFVKNESDKKDEDWQARILLTVGACCLYAGLERCQYVGELNMPLMILLVLVGLTGFILFTRRQYHLLNINLRAGLVLFLFYSFISGIQIVISNSSLNALTASNYDYFWVIALIPIVVILITTVLIQRNRKMIRPVITVGMLLLMISLWLSLKIVSFPAILILSIAEAMLSISILTLALSELEGKELGRGVAYYYVIGKIGGVLTTPLYFVVPYLLEVFK
ncbi:MFS transporter [Chitinophaga sancti]|uniref:MFS transporter n=1 Tax=Chitinophaga sancti TaxID=1004 RepID=UPI002A765794|nr:MFS transporter [Chitinophaga sancti]WPQ65842.1 MFS transporter [Chitinophaga sancti]